MLCYRFELFAELFDYFQHPPAVEDRRGLRQTAKGCTWDAELFLYLFQFAGLLQGPQGRANGVEHVQQEQADVLVHVKDSVARTVSLASGVAKRFQHSGDGLEVLETLKFVFFYFMSLSTHSR